MGPTVPPVKNRIERAKSVAAYRRPTLPAVIPSERDRSARACAGRGASEGSAFGLKSCQWSVMRNEAFHGMRVLQPASTSSRRGEKAGAIQVFLLQPFQRHVTGLRAVK